MTKKSKKSKKAVIKEKHPKSIRLGKKDKKMAIIFGVVIFVFAFLLYARTIPFDLVYFDDDRLILHKKEFNSKIENIPKTFDMTIGVTYYRPVLMISFLLDAQVAGLETSQYRFTNVLLHALGSLIVFVMLIYLRYPPLLSFLFAMLLAAHPILTPAAAWISGRNDSLISIFTLLSFITMIAFFDSKGSKKWLIFAVHILAYTINLYTKESAAFFPIMALVYIFMFRRKTMFKSENMILVGSWFFIGLLWFFMREGALPPGKSPDEISIAAYIENIPALFALIGKTFFPLRMSAIANFESISIVAGVVSVVLMIAIYIWKKDNIDRKRILFGVLWFILFLTPTLLVRIKIDYFDYAEHRIYLPFLGMLIILIEISKGLKIDFNKKSVLAIAAAVIMLFAARSISYSGAFKNGKEFWSHFVKQYRENEMGNFNLAEIFFFKNDYRRADIFYDRSLQFDEESRVHNFIQMTQPSLLLPDNEPNYKRTFTHDDLNALTLYNYLGNRYYLKREAKQAIKFSQMALKIRNNDPYANFLLGRSLNAIGRTGESLPYLELSCSRKNNWSWLSELGIAYYKTKQFEKSYNAFEKAVRLNPKNPKLFLNIGSACTKLNRFQEAEKAYMKSISLDPKQTRPYFAIISFYLDYLHNQEKALQYFNLAKQNGIKVPDEIAKRF